MPLPIGSLSTVIVGKLWERSYTPSVYHIYLLLKDVFKDSPHLQDGENTDDYECKVSQIIYVLYCTWLKKSSNRVEDNIM